MAHDLTVPDATPVLELLETFRRSKVMFAGVELGLFDALRSGPASAVELAQRLSLHADSLEQLLDACVGLTLLTKSAGKYANTPSATAYLTTDSPRRLTGYIQYSNNVMWKMWAHLEGAIREGTHRWQETFGWDGPIFSHFFKTDVARREFLMGMHGYGVLSSPHVVNAFDLSRFRTMVDLGAATGHLVIAACERYPELRGCAFDLPHALDLAREMTAASPARDRLTVAGGDFFADPLPPADLYALGRIIHDWSPEKVDQLLKKVCDALPSGGGLLIAEKMLWEDKTGPRWAQLQSLNMLICTEGRERSLAEYDSILRKAGFAEVSGVRLPVPIDALLAIKA
jgi:acetylserotonin N-methyltransferase